MKKILLFMITGIILSTPSTSHAMYPITEWLSFIERTLQDITDTIAKLDFQDALKMKEEKRKNQDPKANGTPQIQENKSSIPQSEFPPYTTPELQQALAKDEPSIPEVEVLVRDSLSYKSETIEKGTLTERTAPGQKIKTDESDTVLNSLERLQSQALIIYVNSRALARRTLDKRAQAETDADDMQNELDSKASTGSVQKTATTSLMYRTHELLNEIAVLRNSYLELIAIDTMPATEAVQAKKSAADRISDTVKGVLGGN